MKYFVLIFLITTLILKAQVFESGFGSSAILSVKRGGADANNDGIYDFSDINLLGKKVFDQSSGEYDSYYQIPNDENLFFPQSVETSDLNGDGVDEIITFSLGNDENPTLFINAFKGDDGEPLFSKSFTTSSVNSSSPFFNITADFTGDGKGEPGVFFFRKDMANENSSPYPVFVLLDQAGNTTLDYSLESFSIKEGYRISKLYPGDFNGDQYDDFFFLVSIEDELVDGLYSHKMILFDGASLSFNEINPTFFRDKKYTIPVISIGQFSGKSSDEIIFICSEIPKTYQITKFRMAVVDISVSEERIFNLSQFFPNVNFALPQFAVNAALTEENHSVLVSLRTGNDFNGDNLPDQFTFAGINTKTNTILFTKTNNLTANSHITSIIPADFNGDNLDEILTVNKAYGDLDNDGIPDGSQITLYTRTGSEIYTKNSVSIGLNDVSLDDELYDIVPCKLDSDVLTDVAMVFRYGDDTNNDGIKDGSLLCYFEPVTSSLIKSHVSIATDGFSKKIEKILPVNNDITEQELLRMIDLSSQDLSEVKSYFLSRNYDNALRVFLKYYLEKRDEPSDLVKVEYYNSNGNDEFVNRLKKFSTASTLEVPGFQWFGNIYNDPGAAAIRLGRISSTFGERCYSSNGIGEDSFFYGLKSILSHLRYLDRPENLTDANNHALLFEIKEYALATPHIHDFKQFKIGDQFSFQKTLFHRIDGQLDHIFPDGLHDEHSITYSFLIGNTLNIFMKFLSNNNFYYYGENFIHNLVKKSERMFKYFTYMVKPIKVSTVDSVMIKRPDIPVYGDSESKIVNRWYGKQSSGGNYSILNEPFIQDHVDFWTNDTLVDNMRFVVFNSIQNTGVPPPTTSMAFPYGGFFISRSNWVVLHSVNHFDHNARYLHFKAGEVVPTPGPYDGYTTNSRHGHADLLSVDLAGYNKNIVVDPGGYVNPTMTDLINSFDPQYYINLYNFNPPANNFDMVRAYFKSTAAHSTVNIDHGQLTYKSNWRWWDLNTLKSTPVKYTIKDELDLVMGEYSKTNQNGTVIHNRTIAYNKVKKSNTVFGDYWVFIDRIDLSDFNGHPGVEQNWHISPEQVQRSLDSSGKLTGDTFMILPLYEGDKKIVEAELIPSYTMTHYELAESNVLKYKALSNGDKLYFATLIIPFPEGEPIENLVTERIEIFDRNGKSISPDKVSAYKVSFNTSNQDKIEDYFIISFENILYNWIPEFTQKRQTSNNSWEFYRYINGIHYRTESIPSFGKNPEIGNTLPQTFELEPVFPNPFNPETNIKFTLSKSDDVLMEVYTILGERVSTLVDDHLGQGSYTVNFNGESLGSGIYLVKLQAGKNIATQKMVLIK